MKKVSFHIIFLFALSFAVTAILFIDSKFMFAHDSNYPIFPIERIKDWIYAWNNASSNLGNNNAFPRLSIFPYLVLLIPIEYLNISPVYGEIFLLFLFFFTSGTGMYRLAMELFKGRPLIALSSSLLYIFNPVNSTIFDAFTFDGMFGWGAFPWIVYFFIKGIREDKYAIKNAIFFCMAFLFSLPNFQNPPLLGVVFFTLLLFCFLMWSDKRINRINIVKFVSMAATIFIFLNMWVLLPILTTAREYLSNVSETHDLLGSLLGNSHWASLLNILRLLSVALWHNIYLDGGVAVPMTVFYKLSPFGIAMSFFYPLLLAAPLLINKNKLRDYKRYLLLLIFSFIFIILSQGSHAPFGHLFLWLFEHIPGFTMYRNPGTKFTWALMLFYSLLIGYSVYYLHMALRKKAGRGLYIYAGLLTLSLLYQWPWFTGDIVSKGKGTSPSYYVEIPQYYYKAREWSKSQKDDFRYLSLPGIDRDILWGRYDWGYLGVDFTSEMLSKNVVDIGINGGIISYPIRDLSYTLLNETINVNLDLGTDLNESVALYSLLGLMNVKYILLHKDRVGWLGHMYLKAEDPYFLERGLSQSKWLTLEHTFGKLFFYKLDNKYFLPHIYSSLDYQLISSNVKSFFALINTPYFLSYPAFAFTEQQNKDSLLSLVGSQQKQVNRQILIVNSTSNDLVIDLAKAEGQSYNQLSAISGQKPLFIKANKKGKSSFKIKENNLYDIYIESSKILKLKEQSLVLSIHIDGEKLENGVVAEEGNNKWIKVGEAELDKGKHKIRIDSQQSVVGSQDKEKLEKLFQEMEILVVSKEKIEEYKKIIFQMPIGYLFYIDKKKIEDMLKDEKRIENIKLKGDNPFRIGRQEFYVPNDGNYSVKALVKPERDFLISDSVSSSSSSSTKTVLDAISGWDIKALIAEYKENILDDGMHIDAYFQYQGDKKEAVILTKKFSNIDVKERPYLAFSSEIEDIGVQEVEIIVNFIDTNSLFFKNKKLTLKAENRQYVVNVYDKVKDMFGKENVKDLQMNEVVLKFKKKDGVDVSNKENKRYRFIFRNIAFLKTQPILAMFDDRMDSAYLPDVYYNFDKNGDLKNVDFPEQIPLDIKDVYRLHLQRFIDLKETHVLSLSFSKPKMASSQQSAVSIDEDLREFPNKWKVIMGLDFDGDEKEDERTEMLASTGGLVDGKLLLNVKAYEEIKKRFPNKRYYNLLSIGVSHPDDKVVFNRTVMNKKLIKYREHIYKPSDFKVGAGVLEIDGKIYKMANGKGLRAKGDSVNWVEFRNVYLKKGGHDLNVLENDKFKVEMVEIKPAKSYQSIVKSQELPKIEFAKINPTRYVVDVKEAKGPFTLIFSESFHEGWKAYIRQKAKGEGQKAKKEESWSGLWSALKDKGNRIEIKDHFVVNGFANGWMVQAGQKAKGEGQKEQNFEIVLEFKPQRLFELGLLISAITLFGCIGYLFFVQVRR